MAIKRIPEITAEEENFHTEETAEGFNVIRRDGVEPVPNGTLVTLVFRVTSYDRDCDGSLLARLEQVDGKGNDTGLDMAFLGLTPNTTWVLDQPDDLNTLASGEAPRGKNRGPK